MRRLLCGYSLNDSRPLCAAVLKPLPPDPFRHQNSAIARGDAAQECAPRGSDHPSTDRHDPAPALRCVRSGAL